MKKLISYFVVCQLVFAPHLAVAEAPSKKSPAALPAQFLDWQQFKALKPEVRSLYLDYLFYVSAVVQDSHYEDEQILFDQELSASLELKNFFREVFASNEAHAVVPAIVAGVEMLQVGCLTFYTACARAAAKVTAKMASVWSKFRSTRSAQLAIESSAAKTKRLTYKPTSTENPGLEPIPSNKSLTVREEPLSGEVVNPSTSLAKLPEAGADAAGSGRGWVRNTALAAATLAAPEAVGKAAEYFSKTGTVGTQDAASLSAGANLDAKPASHTPQQVASASTNAPSLPTYKREKGALCIFGGYPTSYELDKVGGCKPPKEAINSGDCKKAKKPAFKCNAFGLTEGDQVANQKMCVTLKSGQPLSSLTETCLNKYLDVLHEKHPHQISKGEYEKLIAQINKQLDEVRDGKSSVRKYCGADYTNSGNDKRQQRECEALHGLLAAIEEKASHPQQAASAELAPVAPTTGTPAGATSTH